MNQSDKPDPANDQQRSCGVDDGFNFIVGAVTFVAAILIGYAVYRIWI